MNSIRGWLIGAAVVAGAVLIWDVLSGALSSLLLMFTAVLFAAGLRPIVDRMAKRMPYGVLGRPSVRRRDRGDRCDWSRADSQRWERSSSSWSNRYRVTQPRFKVNLRSCSVISKITRPHNRLLAALAGSAGAAASAIGLHLLNGTALTVAAIRQRRAHPAARRWVDAVER